MPLIEQIARQGWGVLDHFLPPQELQAVHEVFATWVAAGLFSPAKIGAGTDKRLAQDIRGDETWWFDVLHPPRELGPLMARMIELKTQLNRQLFLGLKDWEVHLARYPAQTGYQKHSDRHQRQSARKLSVVVYLNDQWESWDGGELVLYDKADKELERILPLGGRLVAFLSEDFPHEVLPAVRERRSLTGWYLDGAGGIP